MRAPAITVRYRRPPVYYAISPFKAYVKWLSFLEHMLHYKRLVYRSPRIDYTARPIDPNFKVPASWYLKPI